MNFYYGTYLKRFSVTKVCGTIQQQKKGESIKSNYRKGLLHEHGII